MCKLIDTLKVLINVRITTLGALNPNCDYYCSDMAMTVNTLNHTTNTMGPIIVVTETLLHFIVLMGAQYSSNNKGVDGDLALVTCIWSQEVTK